jgi:hypothetical protein
MSAVCSWDSSIHEHEALNRVTANVDRVYAIVKVVVRLSYPAEIDIVLRKRLCFNIYKKKTNSFAQRLMKRIIGMVRQTDRSHRLYFTYFRIQCQSLALVSTTILLHTFQKYCNLHSD